VSARYYNSDLPFSAVWGARGATWTRPLAEYYADCALGTLLGFEAILKLISYRWGLGSLTDRDRHATNIAETFDFPARPDYDVPDLPDPEHVASRPCSLGGGDVLTQESAAAHVGDLAALEDLADRFGITCGDGKVSDLFTQPDAIRRTAKAV
jgi:hypothetical protein